jgi:acetaldehyde dehydrogenase (acetylating)
VFSKLRSRLTYANVAATVALFISVGGGTAWAVDEWTGANIQDETLTGADIQGKAATASTPAVPGTLTGADVKDASITSYDIAPSTIGGGRILDNSLTGADILESSLGKVGDADTLDGMDSTAFLPASAAIAYAKVDAGDASLSDIPADQRAGIVDFTHTPGSFYCFRLAQPARVASATATYDGGDRFPRANAPAIGFCPTGFRDASVVFANSSQNSIDQGFSVVFYP